MAAQAAPEHLFRVFHQASNGINTPTRFAPANMASCADIGTATDLAGHLESAFRGDSLADCRFLFWHESFLFALQYAIFLAAREEQDITIFVLDTTTARTSSGQQLEFHQAEVLLARHGVHFRARWDGSKRYLGEWVTIDQDVVPGTGSAHCQYTHMINGNLEALLPALYAANHARRRFRWASIVLSYRHFMISTQPQHIAEEHMTLARAVASGFKGIGVTSGSTPIFLWLLSLMPRHADDAVFQAWIERHKAPAGAVRLTYRSSASPPVIDLTDSDGLQTEKSISHGIETTRSKNDDDAVITADSTVPNSSTGQILTDLISLTLPEVSQYNQLAAVLSDNSIDFTTSLQLNVTVPSKIIEKQRQLWNTWSQETRDERRAQDPRRTNRSTKQSTRPARRRNPQPNNTMRTPAEKRAKCTKTKYGR